jgi:hypothetical protein
VCYVGFPCELCGVFGVRGMQGYLKMWNYQLRTCVKMCLICYMFGSRRITRVVLCSLSFYIHVLLFPLEERVTGRKESNVQREKV